MYVLTKKFWDVLVKLQPAREWEKETSVFNQLKAVDQRTLELWMNFCGDYHTPPHPTYRKTFRAIAHDKSNIVNISLQTIHLS